jgi:hypothetical protein
LQENVIIKVETGVEGLSEEKSIDMKSEEVYVPSAVAIKTEPEVRLAFFLLVVFSLFVCLVFIPWFKMPKGAHSQAVIGQAII